MNNREHLIVLAATVVVCWPCLSRPERRGNGQEWDEEMTTTWSDCFDLVVVPVSLSLSSIGVHVSFFLLLNFPCCLSLCQECTQHKRPSFQWRGFLLAGHQCCSLSFVVVLPSFWCHHLLWVSSIANVLSNARPSRLALRLASYLKK